MVIKGVANVWVPVRDIERAVHFHHNTLDFALIERDGPWAEVDANGLNIGLNARTERREPGEEPQEEQQGSHSTATRGGPVRTFQVEAGLEAEVEELKGEGVEIAAGISEHQWGRVATFKDSEGNDLQLYEPPSS